MSTQHGSDEEAFLPSEIDRLKAQLKQMKQRLDVATKRKRQLKRALIEEDLAFLTVSRLTELIQDPTRITDFQLNEMQKEVFGKLMKTLEECCVRELISYHRLASRSIFEFKGARSCIRLETFYQKTFKEPFYLIYDKRKGGTIHHHTIPPFISLDHLQAMFLPGNFNTFIRIVHQQVQAYVVRREMTEEIIAMSKEYPVKPIYRTGSVDQFDFQIIPNQMDTLFVRLYYKDRSSAFPTEVDIKCLESVTTMAQEEMERYFIFLQYEFKRKRMRDVILFLTNDQHQPLLVNG
ncbi:hypothetical protein BD560DRAFT_414176 [Blakeslea trispora]|nr:hypothetical protein BD560DRAFT_414176 [Blakeslea trispora]